MAATAMPGATSVAVRMKDMQKRRDRIEGIAIIVAEDAREILCFIGRDSACFSDDAVRLIKLTEGAAVDRFRLTLIVIAMLPSVTLRDQLGCPGRGQN